VNIELDLDERDVDLIGTLIAEHHFTSKSAVARYAIGLLRTEINDNGYAFMKSDDHSDT